MGDPPPSRPCVTMTHTHNMPMECEIHMARIKLFDRISSSFPNILRTQTESLQLLEQCHCDSSKSSKIQLSFHSRTHSYIAIHSVNLRTAPAFVVVWTLIINVFQIILYTHSERWPEIVCIYTKESSKLELLCVLWIHWGTTSTPTKSWICSSEYKQIQ